MIYTGAKTALLGLIIAFSAMYSGVSAHAAPIDPMIPLMNTDRVIPLKVSADLSDRAQKRAVYLCDKSLSHDGWHSFAGEIHFKWLGENLAGGFSTDAGAYKAFMNSPTHRANILSTKYQAAGVGRACGRIVVWFGGK